MNEFEMERLLVRLVGDSSGYTRMLQDATNNTLKYATIIGTTVLGVGGVFNTLQRSIKLAGANETMEVDYGVMLGGLEKGKELVRQMTQMAADTPMTLVGLQGAAKVLLQFGTAGNDIMPTLKMLGDVAGGDAEKLSRLSLAFGQMQSTGKLMGQDLMQMINVGFNPLKEISRTTGQSMSALQQKMEHGGISVQMVKEAFKSATKAGGQFDGMMEKQSKTLNGLMSTLEDDIDGGLRKVGQSIVDNLNLKGFIQDLSAGAKGVSDWFSALDSGTIQLVASFAVASIAVIGLTGLIYALYIAVNFATGGLATVGALIALAVGGAVIGTTLLIQSVGGVANAFKIVKQAATDAWTWLEPIRTALLSFFETIWEVGKEKWEMLKNFIVKTWKSIFGEVDVDWKDVQNTIRDGIYYLEYLVLNFDKAWDVLWSSLKLGVVVALSYVVGYFLGFAVAIKDVFLNLADVVGQFFDNLWKNMKGEGADWAGFKKSFTQVFDVKLEKVKLPPLENVISDLRKEFEANKDKLNQGWPDFLADKLKDVKPSKEIENNMIDLGKGMGDQIKGGMKNSLQNVESVLYGSAEALRRYNEYRERATNEQRIKAGTMNADGTIAGSGALKGANKPIAVNVQPDPNQKRAADSLDKMIDILDDIRDKNGLQVANI